VLPTIQFVERPGILDLGWGHPSPASLPIDAWGAATEAALRKHGWRALTYGYANGPATLVEWLVERLGLVDGRPPVHDEILVTSGASQALELVSGLLAGPGRVVLVDSPTYHLALRILGDREAEVLPAPADVHGIDPDGVADLVRLLGGRVSMVYLVPTYANPTGASLSLERRRALVDVAARAGIVIVEDDTYRELSFVDTAPPSLWSIADAGVVRVGSFSKTVAPGLRLGWLTAPPDFVRRLADRGFIDSGGGLNHTTALAMAEFGASGGYERHLATVRAAYRRRRDVLVKALRRQVPAAFATPEGGWFLWLPLGDNVDADRLVTAAESRGMSFLSGARFFTRPAAGKHHARLSFSMLDEPHLEEAARRFGDALSATP
jgi:2-aminoadipate transaminase